MHSLSLVVSLLLVTAVRAVNFYGSERPNGDYVTCQIPGSTDLQVSSLLALNYTAESLADSNDLAFPGVLTCENQKALELEIRCQELNGTSACISAADTANDENKDCFNLLGLVCIDLFPKKRFQPGRAVKRNLQRRAGGPVCDERTHICRDQYQSSGACVSGYDVRRYTVPGNTPDTWCVKSCSQADAQACDRAACTTPKKKCETTDDRYCGEALLNCFNITPVQIDQSLCTLDLFRQGSYGSFCRGTKLAGVEFKDGGCNVVPAHYQRWTANKTALARPRRPV